MRAHVNVRACVCACVEGGGRSWGGARVLRCLCWWRDEACGLCCPPAWRQRMNPAAPATRARCYHYSASCSVWSAWPPLPQPPAWSRAGGVACFLPSSAPHLCSLDPGLLSAGGHLPLRMPLLREPGHSCPRSSQGPTCPPLCVCVPVLCLLESLSPCPVPHFLLALVLCLPLPAGHFLVLDPWSVSGSASSHWQVPTGTQ